MPLLQQPTPFSILRFASIHLPRERHSRCLFPRGSYNTVAERGQVLGPIGKIAKSGLTRAGYQLYRPTRFERTLLRSIWEDWFSADPAEFARIYLNNRKLLRGVERWADPCDLEDSLWRYGVPEVWDSDDMDTGSGTGLNHIEKEVTYSDLIAFVGAVLGHPVNYFEIGVSVGKNFLQMCHNFRDSAVVGLDVEDINPRLRREFDSEHIVLQSECTYVVDTLKGGRNSASIHLSHHLLERPASPPVLYVKGDQFSDDTWATLQGRQFNLIFSDGVHTADALRRELDFLLEYDLIVREGRFAMLWDDLVDIHMQEAFVDNSRRLQRRFGRESWFGLYWIHGTYGSRRLNGIFSTFRAERHDAST